MGVMKGNDTGMRGIMFEPVSSRIACYTFDVNLGSAPIAEGTDENSEPPFFFCVLICFTK